MGRVRGIDTDRLERSGGKGYSRKFHLNELVALVTYSHVGELERFDRTISPLHVEPHISGLTIPFHLTYFCAYCNT